MPVVPFENLVQQITSTVDDKMLQSGAAMRAVPLLFAYRRASVAPDVHYLGVSKKLSLLPPRLRQRLRTTGLTRGVGLPARVPPIAPARRQPQQEFDIDYATSAA